MNVNENSGTEQSLDEDDWVEPEVDIEIIRHRGLLLAFPTRPLGLEWLEVKLPEAKWHLRCVLVEPGSLEELLAVMRRDGLEVG
jgi:hypothetical protein